jgi:hypothetical protein
LLTDRDEPQQHRGHESQLSSLLCRLHIFTSPEHRFANAAAKRAPCRLPPVSEAIVHVVLDKGNLLSNPIGLPKKIGASTATVSVEEPWVRIIASQRSGHT